MRARPLADSTFRPLRNMLNCEPLEIAFMESATKAWDAVFLFQLPLGAGERRGWSTLHLFVQLSGAVQLARRQGIGYRFCAERLSTVQIDLAALTRFSPRSDVS